MNLFSSDLYDVAVVGSGPAGASAAYCLAKQGLRVVLIEKARLPRYKACGGGLVRRGVELLPFDLRAVIECECYAVQLNLLDAGISFHGRRKAPIVSMTMRKDFDYLLTSAAAAAGTEIRSECRVYDVMFQSDAVSLITSMGRPRARFVIAADGATSLVARKGGWSQHRNLFLALEYEVFVPADLFSRFRGVARFDLGLVPQGYAWVFPKKDHLSIGIGNMRGRPIDLKGSMQRYFKKIGIDGTDTDRVEAHAFLIPVSPRRGGFGKNRILLTGDAAGFADPLTGEGITYAIASGQMAAQALLEGDFNPARVQEAYDLQIRQKILPELHISRFLAKLIYGHPGVRNGVLRVFGQGLFETVIDLFSGWQSCHGWMPDLLHRFRQLDLWYTRRKLCGGKRSWQTSP